MKEYTGILNGDLLYFYVDDGTPIITTIEATEEELRRFCEKEENYIAIEQLKSQLAATDYKAIKYFEGWMSEEDYAPIKEERKNMRDRINELELVIAICDKEL